jgi:hypothetical protein
MAHGHPGAANGPGSHPIHPTPGDGGRDRAEPRGPRLHAVAMELLRCLRSTFGL